MAPTIDPLEEPVTAWLLRHPEPAIRYLTRRDVLGERPPYDAGAILSGPLVATLLSGQQRDGGFGGHPYRKWTGAFWRVAALAELAAPADHPPVHAAVDHVLSWLTGPTRRTRGRVVDGLTRHCASQDGLGLAAACRLGVAGDPRAEQLARWLVRWQWPDGGWNCDVAATGSRSSFHETHAPIDGLAQYAAATGATWAADAADAAAELLLSHRIFRTRTNPGHVIDPAWLRLRFPAYWHYDVLRALVVLARAGHVRDHRTSDALELLEWARGPDGRWRADGAWWRSPGSRGPGTEVVSWGRGRSNAMLNVQCLTVQRAAGTAG